MTALERLADAPVQPHAPRAAELLVERLADQRVREGEAARGARNFGEDPRAARLVERVEQRVARKARRRPRARAARTRARSPPRRAAPRSPSPRGARDAGRSPRARLRGCRAPRAARSRPAAALAAQRADSTRWRSTSSAKNGLPSVSACEHAHEALGCLVLRARGDHAAPSSAGIEAAQQHPLDARLAPQVSQQLGERMRAREIGLAVGAEQEQRRRPRRAREMAQQDQRRLVGPVQIVEQDQHEGAARGVREQRIDGLEEAPALRLGVEGRGRRGRAAGGAARARGGVAWSASAEPARSSPRAHAARGARAPASRAGTERRGPRRSARRARSRPRRARRARARPRAASCRCRARRRAARGAARRARRFQRGIEPRALRGAADEGPARELRRRGESGIGAAARSPTRPRAQRPEPATPSAPARRPARSDAPLPAASASTSALARIWPGFAAAHSRAASTTTRPWTPSASSRASPAAIPTRASAGATASRRALAARRAAGSRRRRRPHRSRSRTPRTGRRRCAAPRARARGQRLAHHAEEALPPGFARLGAEPRHGLGGGDQIREQDGDEARGGHRLASSHSEELEGPARRRAGYYAGRFR